MPEVKLKLLEMREMARPARIAAPFNAWSNLGPAVEALPGTFQFTDPGATNYPLRFYRVTAP